MLSTTRTRKKRKRAILWISRPFAGKDTQTKRLQRCGMPVFETGERCRNIRDQDPNGEVAQAMKKGLVPDHLLWPHVQSWTNENSQDEILHYNGVPRNVAQLEKIIPLLQSLGYLVCVVWFTTPETECMKRPSRPGREIEDTPENREPRMRTYDNDTLPIYKELQRFNITQDNARLYCVDNTDKQPHEVAAGIIRHFGLPVSADDLFPKANSETEPAAACLATA